MEEGKATVRLREPAVDVCLSKVGAGAAGGTPARNRCLGGNRGVCGGGRGVFGRGLLRDRAGWASVGLSVCLSARGLWHRFHTATES